MPDRHGRSRLQNDLSAHHGHLDSCRGYVVLADDLRYGWIPIPPRPYRIEGRVHCDHGRFVDARKTLETRDDNVVRTNRYGYHAGIEGARERPIFRYDNAHAYLREDHPDEHHKHRFDPVTWQEIEPPSGSAAIAGHT